jgi:hypothetical protein
MNLSSYPIAPLSVLITLHGKLKHVTPDQVWSIAQDLETRGGIDLTTLDYIRRNRVMAANDYNRFVDDYEAGNGERYAAYMTSPESIK